MTRRHILPWAAIMLTVVLLAAGLGWVLTANAAAGAVSVAWLPGVSRCTGHALGRAPRNSGLHGPMIYVRRGTRCTLLVRVVHNSSHSVRLAALSGDLLGSQTGHILTGIGATNGGQPVGQRLDAYWPVNQTIAPHHAVRYRIRIGYRASGCDVGGLGGIGGFPDAHISILGRDYTRLSHTWLRWTQRGPSPGCRVGHHA